MCGNYYFFRYKAAFNIASHEIFKKYIHIMNFIKFFILVLKCKYNYICKVRNMLIIIVTFTYYIIILHVFVLILF